MQNVCASIVGCRAFVSVSVTSGASVLCSYTPLTQPSTWIEDSTAITYIRNCASAIGSSTNGTVGSVCESHADCTGTNTQCLVNVCLCSSGYSLNPAAQVCLSGKLHDCAII